MTEISKFRDELAAWGVDTVHLSDERLLALTVSLQRAYYESGGTVVATARAIGMLNQALLVNTR